MGYCLVGILHPDLTMMLSVNQNWDGCDCSDCVVVAVDKSYLGELHQREICANVFQNTWAGFGNVQTLRF